MRRLLIASCLVLSCLTVSAAPRKSPAKKPPTSKPVAAPTPPAPPPEPIAPPDLETTAEKTAFARTGRYDEAERLCRDFEIAYPGRVACRDFGRTPEGRTMKCLVASDDGALDPKTARERGRTVVLAQGGIHAGEIDGKDAGFMALHEALDVKGGTLAKVTFVFVPVFNIDGHERFGANNRPNQVGPEEMGWRTTAQNYNLNRDFTKLDAPETRALVALLDAWDPEIFLDLHVTDGAEFQHDVAVMVEPAEVGPTPLRAPARALRAEVLQRLTSAGHLPLPYYPSFRDGDDPTSGVVASAFGPRFAHGYWGWRERLGLLVETHSWKPYGTRVHATKVVLESVLDAAARDGASWRAAAQAADAEAAALPGHDVPLAFEPNKSSEPTDFLGVEYERVPSAISGALVTRYHSSMPQTWTIPLFSELVPSASAHVPLGGYVVPAAFADEIAPLLDLHGVAYSRLPVAAKISGESWRATEVTFATAPFENRFAPTAKGAWAKDTRDESSGSLFVPTAQPRARLVTMLFDPAGPDSFLQWGFFNACFERKEYMEAYVAEDVAQKMLARDPALAAEFAVKLAKDPAFAKDPAARLDFFYKRHPAWDDRLNLYPVLRTETVLASPPAAAR